MTGALDRLCMILQEEYAREGIDWSYVEFIDNQDCLDVLEGSQDTPSLAVFPLIDEACRLPRATYQVCPTCLAYCWHAPHSSDAFWHQVQIHIRGWSEEVVLHPHEYHTIM